MTVPQKLSKSLTPEAQFSHHRRMSTAIWDDDCHPAQPIADVPVDSRLSVGSVSCLLDLCSRYSHARGRGWGWEDP